MIGQPVVLAAGFDPRGVNGLRNRRRRRERRTHSENRQTRIAPLLRHVEILPLFWLATELVATTIVVRIAARLRHHVSCRTITPDRFTRSCASRTGCCCTHPPA